MIEQPSRVPTMTEGRIGMKRKQLRRLTRTEVRAMGAGERFMVEKRIAVWTG